MKKKYVDMKNFFKGIKYYDEAQYKTEFNSLNVIYNKTIRFSFAYIFNCQETNLTSLTHSYNSPIKKSYDSKSHLLLYPTKLKNTNSYGT